MEPACVFRTVPSTSVCALLELVYGLHPAMSVATGTAHLRATHAAHMSRCGGPVSTPPIKSLLSADMPPALMIRSAPSATSSTPPPRVPCPVSPHQAPFPVSAAGAVLRHGATLSWRDPMPQTHEYVAALPRNVDRGSALRFLRNWCSSNRRACMACMRLLHEDMLHKLRFQLDLPIRCHELMPRTYARTQRSQISSATLCLQKLESDGLGAGPPAFHRPFALGVL